MTEEFDVFGDLDALCDDNLLAKFKTSVPSLKSNKSDSDIENDDFLEIENGKKMGAKKKNTKTLNELVAPIFAASSKQKSPLKRGSVAKICSPEKRFSPPVEGSISPIATLIESPSVAVTEPVPSPVLPEPATRKRLTRSMCKNKSKEAATTTTTGTSVTSTVTTTTAQPPSRGRGRGRGRKQQQNQNSTITETLGNLFNLSESMSAHQMLNRRSIAAARAAMCPQVDYVDLVSSPVPKISGVINVDSDTEDNLNSTTSTPVTKTSSLDHSFDEQNPEISVKVLWNGNPEIFKLRRHQKFAHIFNTIALRENTEEKNLVFNLNNKILSEDDTPHSIDYKIFQFISGRVLVSKFGSSVAPTRKKRDANKISLKIQSDKWKKPIQIELMRTDNFRVLYIKCAEELNMSYENFKLSFDGDPLEFGDTPATLELEGGEAIDLRIRN